MVLFDVGRSDVRIMYRKVAKLLPPGTPVGMSNWAIVLSVEDYGES